jgi:hypothetical protein
VDAGDMIVLAMWGKGGGGRQPGVGRGR